MCGLPLCLVPEGVPIARDAPLPDGFNRRAGSTPAFASLRFDGGEFLKAEPCTRCSLEPRCWGLRRGYAEMHGTGELRAVETSGETA
jgi:hypothetical protein